jgi:antitoxin ParD1/3/4
MNVNLGPVLDQFVAELLKTGHYQTQSEVLREGLRLLKEREVSKQIWIAETRKAIAQGIEQADRGEFVDGPAVFEKIRRRSASVRRKRK